MPGIIHCFITYKIQHCKKNTIQELVKNPRFVQVSMSVHVCTCGERGTEEGAMIGSI
jgi:hypothetical protein